MSSETELYRHQLADLIHEHPKRDWSPGMLRAVNVLMDIYLEDGLQERPLRCCNWCTRHPYRKGNDNCNAGSGYRT